MLTTRRLFLSQAGALMMGVAAPGLFNGAAPAGKSALPRSKPESQGVSSAGILKFVREAEKQNAGLHSFMVVRHGHVIAEGWWYPYAPEIPHELYSLSKNFASTAIGFAVQEKILTVEDKVISFFPDSLPGVLNDHLRAMTVRDLLIMASGHSSDTLWPMLRHPERNWPATFFATPLEYPPGTRFVYDSGCTYMLSAILQRLTGMTMSDYLQPRLFQPLGITEVTWDCDPRGVNVGAAGLWLKTEDLAKFGEFYLRKGKWNGRQLLSEEWIEEATSFKIRNDETGTPTKKEEDDIKQGYGYQFWMSRPVAKGAYRAEGAFCQYSIVMPHADAVVAITAEGISTKRVMDLVWYTLMPALEPDKLLPDQQGYSELTAKLKGLRLEPPELKHAFKPSGPMKRKYVMDRNTLGFEYVYFEFGESAATFTVETGEKTCKIVCGSKDWHMGNTDLPGSPPNLLAPVPLPRSVWKVAAFGDWSDEQTFVMTWRFFETPHYDIVTCRFGKDTLEIQFANSITRILNTVRDPRPVLMGKLV